MEEYAGVKTPHLNPYVADGDALDSFAHMFQGLREGADRTPRRESTHKLGVNSR